MLYILSWCRLRDMIWGVKTVSVFDVWTFEHLLSGISIGALAIHINSKVFKNRFKVTNENNQMKYFDILFVLLIAYCWETVEHYLEVGLMGIKVEYWFQGVEYWANRILSDPLITVVGYYIAKNNPNLVLPARIISIIWLFIHVVIFPHSMYLHEIFH